MVERRTEDEALATASRAACAEASTLASAAQAVVEGVVLPAVAEVPVAELPVPVVPAVPKCADFDVRAAAAVCGRARRAATGEVDAVGSGGDDDEVEEDDDEVAAAVMDDVTGAARWFDTAEAEAGRAPLPLPRATGAADDAVVCECDE